MEDDFLLFEELYEKTIKNKKNSLRVSYNE